MQTDLLPGERRLHDGLVYCFDLDMRADHLAQVRVAAAPADLTMLSDDDLTALRYAISRDWSVRKGGVADPRLGQRVDAERARRQVAAMLERAQ